MATRTAEEQSAHDGVISDLAGVYQRANWSVRANPNVHRSGDTGGWWIDVLVSATPTSEDAFAFEVETEDTVSEEEATSQWAKYARNYANWFLAVPSGTESRARSLLSRQGITNCKVVTWCDSSRGYVFYGLPGA